MKSIRILSASSIFVALLLLSTSIDAFEEDCVDYYGNMVAHGLYYVPGPSACTICVCFHSKPMRCQTIFCQTPYYCKKLQVGEKCCEFQCLDSPEEIQRMKEKLKKRRRFLGIVFETNDAIITNRPPTTYLILCIAILLKINI